MSAAPVRTDTRPWGVSSMIAPAPSARPVPMPTFLYELAMPKPMRLPGGGRGLSEIGAHSRESVGGRLERAQVADSLVQQLSRPGALARGEAVLPPEPDRIHAEGAGRARPSVSRRRSWPGCCRSRGRRRSGSCACRPVRVGDDRPDFVGARRRHRGAEYHRNGLGDVGSGVGDRPGLHGQDRPVARSRVTHPDAHGVALGAHPDRLLAREGHAHWPARKEGAEGGLYLDRRLLLAAESPAASDEDDAYLVVGKGETGRYHAPVVAGALVAREYRHAAVGVRYRQAGLRLEVGMLDRLSLVLVLDHDIGRREGLARVALAHVGLVDDVALRIGVKERGSLLHVRLGRGQDGELLVAHRYERPSGLGLLARLGQHDGDHVIESLQKAWL